MTYDPNREPRGRDRIGRDRGMWGWIIAIAAVIILGIIVWAAVDTEPDVAGTTPPASQGTVGSAPKGTTGTTGSAGSTASETGSSATGGTGSETGNSPKSGTKSGTGDKQ